MMKASALLLTIVSLTVRLTPLLTVNEAVVLLLIVNDFTVISPLSIVALPLMRTSSLVVGTTSLLHFEASLHKPSPANVLSDGLTVTEIVEVEVIDTSPSIIALSIFMLSKVRAS